MVVVFPSPTLAPGDSDMSELDEVGFHYTEIDSLPDYWRMKIEGGFQRRSPACPYDGGGLVKEAKPIPHVRCVRCGRNYA